MFFSYKNAMMAAIFTNYEIQSEDTLRSTTTTFKKPQFVNRQSILSLKTVKENEGRFHKKDECHLYHTLTW